MRHYEVVYLVHQDQSDEIENIMQLYKNMITENGGKIHRAENWGRKSLAYQINNTHKANYILMNIECDIETLKKLEYNFNFSDAVIRNLITVCKKAITSPSEMAEEESKKRAAKFINYKCIDNLKNYIMETGRLIPSRVSNISARDQRRITSAVKLARFLALLPYCDRHE